MQLKFATESANATLIGSTSTHTPHITCVVLANLSQLSELHWLTC